MRKLNYVLPLLLLAIFLALAWLALRTAREMLPAKVVPPAGSTPDAQRPAPDARLAPRHSTPDTQSSPPDSTPDARHPTPDAPLDTRQVPLDPHPAPLPSPPDPLPPPLVLAAEPLPDDPAPYMDRHPAAAIQVVKMTPVPALLRASPSGNFIRQLVLPLPGGRTAAVRITNHRVMAKDRGVFTGHVEGLPLSEVILSYYQDAITANIFLPGDGHYAIATEGEIQLLITVDPDKILPGADPIIPPIQEVGTIDNAGGLAP